MGDYYGHTASTAGTGSISGNSRSFGTHTTAGSGAVPLSDPGGKIFVGGLSWQTTEEALRFHFEQYGPVESVEVMRDRNTGKP
jgi:RNA recognition motif-containing protein